MVVLKRVVLVARLKSDAYERAEELASAEAQIGPDLAGLRYSVFLSPSEVVFMAEGNEVEHRLREWFNDPARSTGISPWLPLFDGPLHAAVEVTHAE